MLLTGIILLSTILKIYAHHSEVLLWHHPGSNCTSEISRCIQENFDGKAVLQRIYTYTDDGFTAWLDAGNDYSHIIEARYVNAVQQCLNSSNVTAYVEIRSHNDYAVSGSRQHPDDLENFYRYFAKGYPLDYNPDSISDTASNASNVSDYHYYRRGMPIPVDKPNNRSQPRRPLNLLVLAWSKLLKCDNFVIVLITSTRFTFS
ncbi:hypothetical protein SPOG_04235 [Schizosaccharomyces cryophilus OY26]|uniref:Uncharacterized protein n=1 Tax=Schizosaccharomyces cryophilus (strain OY26 / ATCC MYA-4695 / CBS 11777 / NBRC 106824 / NRRL Y48691) TaxID=653667 RepID=S9VTP0_SCHCR|nr:uncharacterized protein SPOG_04235 [Schizosaccharomyces cryophilus OY26]EPY49415.1 hypothetical protein SPOG_04235 [Schizosaccharomyces cryophilus OY26]